MGRPGWTCPRRTSTGSGSPSGFATPGRVARPDSSSAPRQGDRDGRSRRGPGLLPRPVSWDEPDWLHAGRFGEDAPLLAVHLGAGTAAKRWPTGHWKDLIGRFLGEGWRVILVGGSDDVAIGAAMGRHERLRDWTGQLRLTETAALLERADFFIGSDSGPAHVAASAGIPSVVLFSGTNRPRQWRPWSRRTMILRNRVACRPCHQKVCPLADHPCMSGITPERVHRASQRWWRRLHRQESPHAPI